MPPPDRKPTHTRWAVIISLGIMSLLGLGTYVQAQGSEPTEQPTAALLPTQDMLQLMPIR